MSLLSLILPYNQFPYENNATHKNTNNIFYNNASNNIISGNIATSISDHFTQFLLVPGQLAGVQTHKAKEKRSFYNFDPKTFEKDIENIDWNRTLEIPSGNPNL